jgi:hypothetical protein
MRMTRTFLFAAMRFFCIVCSLAAQAILDSWRITARAHFVAVARACWPTHSQS